MKNLVTILAILLPLLPLSGTEADSVDDKRKTYYVGAYFAGNTGLVSINGGKKFISERLLLGGGYGYLPELINGTEVHSVFIKTSYNFSKGLIYKKASWYAGLTTFYGITDNTFIKLPSRYPEKYYAPNAIHVAPYLGLRMPLAFYKPIWADKVNFHIELGTLDSYLWYHLTNRRINFWDICNISYGIYYDFYSHRGMNRKVKPSKI